MKPPHAPLLSFHRWRGRWSSYSCVTVHLTASVSGHQRSPGESDRSDLVGSGLCRQSFDVGIIQRLDQGDVVSWTEEVPSTALGALAAHQHPDTGLCHVTICHLDITRPEQTVQTSCVPLLHLVSSCC